MLYAKDVDKLTATSLHQTTNWWLKKKMQYRPAMNTMILHKRVEHLGARINPYPKVFPYRNGMVLHFYQQQDSSTTKTVHKGINKGLKTYV